jgi:hypothetical protein
VMSPRQIAQLGDSQPHLVVADDRCLAGSTGEHHIAAPANSDKGRSDAPILVGSISEPSQAQPHHVAIPS